jgi:hypothetical protein
LEQALQWISKPVGSPPPKELDNKVSPEEWFSLTQLWHNLMAEKLHQQVH